MLRVLTPIRTSRPETATKLRSRPCTMLAWAQAHSHVKRNVAGDTIDGALPVMPAVKAHFRALAYRDVAEAPQTIEVSPASVSTKVCLRFVTLTAYRSGEAQLATWAEFAIQARACRLPAATMRGGPEPRARLSDAAVDVLEVIRHGLLFGSPSRPSKPLSDTTLTRVLRDIGLARATVHGFGSNFRDCCAGIGQPREIAEAVLAHTVGRVEGAYFHSDLFERPRRLTDQWTAFEAASGAKVARLHG